MLKIIVAGGAGFIGSHTVVELLKAGYEPVILDNFSGSKPGVIDQLETLTNSHLNWYNADLLDPELTKDIFLKEKPDGVIHFIGLKAVGESVEKPLDYYQYNLDVTFSILKAMRASNCENIVFSSSATVYGDDPAPVEEDMPALDALNPYGYTKIVIERILRDIASVTPLKVALLRYFNPVGAHPSGLIGEDPNGIPTNIMPRIAQTAVGIIDHLDVYGTDYATPDGTCLRDYIHVVDLAAGHVAALNALPNVNSQVNVWNLGTGNAISVLELIRGFEKVSGKRLNVSYVGRRQGDRAAIWADASRAKKELDWEANLDLNAMCRDTWNWIVKNPNGFSEDIPKSRPHEL